MTDLLDGHSAYRILVTGSRDWPDNDDHIIFLAIRRWLDAQRWVSGSDPNPVVVHGGARGVDTVVDAYAESRGWEPECHPADWKCWGRSAGHRRNAEMVRLGADVCVAFPIGASPGTRGCMKMAQEAGIRVIDYGVFDGDLRRLARIRPDPSPDT